MLHIFRKYQKSIYLVITVVIIISFSFFGTYSTLDTVPERKPKPAFTAIDGSQVTDLEVERMAQFLATDSDDKIMVGGAWGPNFLNDGVIQKDFLKTGLGEILVSLYPDALREDLEVKIAKEKRFAPYQHPSAQFLSAKSVWSYFMPEIIASLETLQNSGDPVSEEALAARLALFNAQKKFPPETLRQILRYQAKQYGWVQPDPKLERGDLSLFEYHFVEDWFGPRFTRLVAEFVINAAKIAEEKGYRVSEDEALASILELSKESFEKNRASPHLGVRSSGEYFKEQVRKMGLTESQVVEIWQQVLLFRRLFHHFGGSAFTDTLTYQQFLNQAQEYLEGTLFQLPEELRIGSFKDLQEFQVYLVSVAEGPLKGLEFPAAYKDAQALEKEAPELVQTRYLVEVRHVPAQLLQSKVGLKEMWQWQSKDANWSKIIEKYPSLGIKQAKDVRQRMAALDELDATTRSNVDSFSRKEIMKEHPEWLKESLTEATPEKKVLSLSKGAGVPDLTGLENADKLMAALNQKDEVEQYTENGNHFYRFNVIERSEGPEVMTFKEAKTLGAIQKRLLNVLEKHYQQIRESDPKQYQRADGSWKPLQEVRSEVAKDYYAGLLDQLQSVYKSEAVKSAISDQPTPDLLAPYRFHNYMSMAREALRSNPKDERFIAIDDETSQSDEVDALPNRVPLNEQWKLKAESQRLERGDRTVASIEPKELFQLTINEWSKLAVPVNGDLSFFQLEDNGVDDYSVVLSEKVMEAYHELSAEAQRVLMRHLMGEIQAKNAISLEYMDRGQPEEEMEGGDGSS